MEGGRAMFRQAWLMAVVGVLLIGCAFLLVVGCSGDTGSQPTGPERSEDSRPTDTGTERTGAREDESTAALSGQGGSPKGESTHEVAQHCGSQASQESETTDGAAQHGGSIEHISGYGGFMLRVGGIVYDTPFEGAVNQMTYNTTTSEVVGRRLDNEDLGPLFAEATHEATEESTDLTTTSSSATSDEEVPVYAVEGYDPSFRLAACLGDRPIMFEALSNPEAHEAPDLLDIDGKVSSIDITSREAAKTLELVYGSIEEPEKVGRLVQGLMGAPLEQTSIGEISTVATSSGGGERSAPISPSGAYLVVFHLEDGTAVARDYWAANGGLSDVAYGADLDRRSAIVAPPAFRRAFGVAVKAWLEHEKHIPENLTEAGKRRQELTCGDDQTAKEARTFNGGGVVYTTNDVYPGGPWGGVLRGTEGDDSWLDGDSGEDEVHGLGGNDQVEGGACDDKVYGGPGDDGAVHPSDSPPISGGLGSDVVYGGPGDDTLDGGDGKDVLYGGPGNDDGVYGGEGKDVIYGGDGDDRLEPGKDGQRDEIHCGKGNDVVLVGASADKIDHADDSCEKKERTYPAVY